MIPYNPFALHILWFNAWRDHIRDAKAYSDQAWGYCQAAVLAQAEYVMALAIEMGKEKSK